MGRASNQKWIHRAERVVNLTRRRLVPAESMFTWRRINKFWLAMRVVLARPAKVVRPRRLPYGSALNYFRSLVGRRLRPAA